jgi:hypothetical protein
MILQYEIDHLKCQYDSILRSFEFSDEQIDNFVDYVIPSLARRNANMKQKKLHPSALDANYDKFSCGFQSCGGQFFSSKQKYVQHLYAKHRKQLPDGCRFLAPNDKSLYVDDLKCPGCNKVYSRIDKLQGHLKGSWFCKNEFNKLREAEQREAVEEEGASNQHSVEEEGASNQHSDEEEGASNQQSVEEEGASNQHSDEEEGASNQQSVEEEEASNQQSVEEEVASNQHSDEEEGASNQQSVEAEIEQSQLRELLNEKQVVDYKLLEQSGEESLDFEESLLIEILSNYEQPNKETNKSKRKHITPSCSREQIAKKQTTD